MDDKVIRPDGVLAFLVIQTCILCAVNSVFFRTFQGEPSASLESCHLKYASVCEYVHSTHYTVHTDDLVFCNVIITATIARCTSEIAE